MKAITAVANVPVSNTYIDFNFEIGMCTLLGTLISHTTSDVLYRLVLLYEMGHNMVSQGPTSEASKFVETTSFAKASLFAMDPSSDLDF